MQSQADTRRIAMLLNAAALYAVAGLLMAAFALQLALGELPCQLCLLQRLAMALMAVGPILNLRYGPRPSHYGLSLLAAVAGTVFAGRQILLHIVPPDPGFGSAVLGLHYYTWAFVVFAVAVVLVGLMLVWDRQFEVGDAPRRATPLETLAVWLVIAVTAANVLATVLQCGFSECPDDPKHYRLLGGD
jgi:disulfide bond formation protein DsbB